MKDDGSVWTWGDSLCGGCGNSRLKSKTRMRTFVQSGAIDVIATDCAFAVLKQDGSVATWGYHDYGADASS
eukprot:742415-Karenia_brevis.AAC.1